jgi:hypothetical protein
VNLAPNEFSAPLRLPVFQFGNATLLNVLPLVTSGQLLIAEVFSDLARQSPASDDRSLVDNLFDSLALAGPTLVNNMTDHPHLNRDGLEPHINSRNVNYDFATQCLDAAVELMTVDPHALDKYWALSQQPIEEYD